MKMRKTLASYVGAAALALGIGAGEAYSAPSNVGEAREGSTEYSTRDSMVITKRDSPVVRQRYKLFKGFRDTLETIPVSDTTYVKVPVTSDYNSPKVDSTGRKSKPLIELVNPEPILISSGRGRGVPAPKDAKSDSSKEDYNSGESDVAKWAREYFGWMRVKSPDPVQVPYAPGIARTDSSKTTSEVQGPPKKDDNDEMYGPFLPSEGKSKEIKVKKNQPIVRRKSHIIAGKRFTSAEVLVQWDREKDRKYTGMGIPVMTRGDTLDVGLGGNYSLHLYEPPRGVKVENGMIITSGDADEGMINGVVFYRNPKTKKVEEAVRLIVPVFTGKDLEKRIRELDQALIDNAPKEERVPSTEDLIVDRERKSGGSRTGLIVGGHVGQVNGFDVGVQRGNFAVVGSYNLGRNKDVHQESGPVSSTGMQGGVRTDNEGYKAFGVTAEVHPSNVPVFFGAGVNLWNFDQAREVAITKTDGTVKRDSDMTPKSEVSARIHTGLKVNTSKKKGKTMVEILAGYDTNQGFLAGLRLNTKIGK